MEYILPVLKFVMDNWEPIVTVVVSLLGLLSRRVSKSRAEALAHVAEVIEALDVSVVKQAVAASTSKLSPAAQDAISDAAKTVDPKQPTPTATEIFVRELRRAVSVKK